MKITTLFFDLDNTLYPPSCGVWQAISQRINDFMEFELKICTEKIGSIREYSRDNFGSTLKGLQSLYTVKESDYLDYVHDVDLAEYLSADDELTEMLSSLSQRKIVFTNSDKKHARRVLEKMGIANLFDQTIDVYDISPFSKPQKESFLLALDLAKEPFPQQCAMIDDNLPNLVISIQLGFLSIQVWVNTPGFGNIINIPNMLDLPKAL